jgi:GNAT superfamily N-acetyltransferase
MEVRQLTSHPADVEAWATLIAVAFNRPVAEARALWSWFNTHQALLAWGAWDGDTLAAQYSCLIRQLQLSNSNSPLHTVGLSTNMAVHPRYRGRGLIKQIAEPIYDTLRKRGALAGVGFSNARGVKVDQRSKSYGYRVVGALSSQLIWLRPVQAVPLLLASNWPQEQTDPVTCPSRHIHFEASTHILHHRYAEHPFRHYRYGACVGDGATPGVATSIVIDRPEKVLGVRGASLLHAHAASPTALRELLMRWSAAVQAQGAKFVRVLATPCAPALQVLHQLGNAVALRPRHPHYLTVKLLQPDASPELFDLTRWDCLGGEVL